MTSYKNTDIVYLLDDGNHEPGDRTMAQHFTPGQILQGLMKSQEAVRHSHRLDRTITTYATTDALWNAQSALARWHEVPHQTINTDGNTYEVTPYLLEAGAELTGWFQSSPGELEQLLQD